MAQLNRPLLATAVGRRLLEGHLVGADASPGPHGRARLRDRHSPARTSAYQARSSKTEALQGVLLLPFERRSRRRGSE